MGAALYDLSMIQDQDLVGVDESRQAVGDDDGRMPPPAATQRIEDEVLRLGVHGAERVVENENGRFPQECPGQRQPAAAAPLKVSPHALPPGCRSPGRTPGWPRGHTTTGRPRQSRRARLLPDRVGCCPEGSSNTETVPASPSKFENGLPSGPPAECLPHRSRSRRCRDRRNAAAG